MLVLNAFSLNMLAEDILDGDCVISSHPLNLEEAKKAISEEGVESAVGHADTAAVFSTLLGVEIQFNRATVALKKGDTALVGQYRGPRMPEGAKTLPEGSRIDWLLVTIG